MVAHEDLVISLGEITIIDFRHLSRKVNQADRLDCVIYSVGIELVSDISTVHILKWCLRVNRGFPNWREEPELAGFNMSTRVQKGIRISYQIGV